MKNENHPIGKGMRIKVEKLEDKGLRQANQRTLGEETKEKIKHKQAKSE